MRINPNHRLRKIGSHHMIVDACAENANLTNVYVLNETAAFLWECVNGTEFDTDTLIDCLCREYEVDPAQARADIEELIAKWRANNIVTD